MSGLALQDKDPYNYSDKFNTPLTDEERKQFEYDIYSGKYPIKMNDIYDYDIQGAWKALKEGRIQFDERMHLTDEFKKPNHPTFSSESMYAKGYNPYIAGYWNNKTGNYIPGLDNIYTDRALREYFNDIEPASQLIDTRDPNSATLNGLLEYRNRLNNNLYRGEDWINNILSIRNY